MDNVSKNVPKEQVQVNSNYKFGGREVDRKYAIGEISAADYVKQTGAKRPSLLGKTNRERKRWTKQDADQVTAFAEFLKHAGPAPQLRDGQSGNSANNATAETEDAADA